MNDEERRERIREELEQVETHLAVIETDLDEFEDMADTLDSLEKHLSKAMALAHGTETEGGES